MSHPRSKALPAPLALVAFALGLAGMMGGGALAVKLATQGVSLGLRPTLVLAELLLVFPALLLLTLWRRLDTLDLGRHTGLGVPLAVVLGAALWITSAGLLEVQSSLFPPTAEFVEAFRRLHAALRPTGLFDGLLSILTIGVAPAVCEEILFRGVLLPSLWRRVGSVAAVIGSAILFASIHPDYIDASPDVAFDRVPFALFMGLALGALRVRSGSLLPCILAHATVNTLTFLIAPLVDDPSQPVPASQPALGLGLLLAGAMGSLALLKRTRQALPDRG